MPGIMRVEKQSPFFWVTLFWWSIQGLGFKPVVDAIFRKLSAHSRRLPDCFEVKYQVPYHKVLFYDQVTRSHRHLADLFSE